jgi:hypothetical protein
VVGTCGLGGACEVHVVPSRNIFPFIIIIIIIFFFFFICSGRYINYKAYCRV